MSEHRNKPGCTPISSTTRCLQATGSHFPQSAQKGEWHFAIRCALRFPLQGPRNSVICAIHHRIGPNTNIDPGTVTKEEHPGGVTWQALSLGTKQDTSSVRRMTTAASSIRTRVSCEVVSDDNRAITSCTRSSTGGGAIGRRHRALSAIVHDAACDGSVIDSDFGRRGAGEVELSYHTRGISSHRCRR